MGQWVNVLVTNLQPWVQSRDPSQQINKRLKYSKQKWASRPGKGLRAQQLCRLVDSGSVLKPTESTMLVCDRSSWAAALEHTVQQQQQEQLSAWCFLDQ